MNLKNMKIRLPMYLVGLFIMTIGIAISVKSNLGVSPVSSIPYTMTCIWGIEMGKATILFHIVLVLIQLIILRKNFKLISLLQIPVGVVFGYFTTFCNYLVSFFPTPDNIVIRIIMRTHQCRNCCYRYFPLLAYRCYPACGRRRYECGFASN